MRGAVPGATNLSALATRLVRTCQRVARCARTRGKEVATVISAFRACTPEDISLGAFQLGGSFRYLALQSHIHVPNMLLSILPIGHVFEGQENHRLAGVLKFHLTCMQKEDPPADPRELPFDLKVVEEGVLGK